ncbi:hypothetical protein HaLaN_31989, partial [Haematococcus lacustris]
QARPDLAAEAEGIDARGEVDCSTSSS